tara:strand:- start:440 stop:1627 length:1188 start_codon:yes stop_codon:yes gene_type:complete
MKQKTNFRFTTAIKKIRNMKARIKVIPGGTSAGKTFAILAVLIDKAIKEPGMEISIVAETIPALRRGANKDFLKIMKDTGRYISNNYNKTLLKYTFTNGSYIEFFSADNDSKLRGSRRTCLMINECNNVSFEVYQQLAIRTSGDIYLDYNPTSNFWVDTDILTQPNSEKLTLTYKDNEALSEEIINQLESYREKAKTSTYYQNWVRVYLDGLTGMIEGTIYDNYEVIDNIPEEARLLCAALDWGYSVDPTALVVIYKYNQDIIVDEVFYQKGLLNSDIANLIKLNNVTGEIFCDSSEPKSIAELKKYGIQAKPVEKGSDSVKFGIQLVQERKMYITRRSVNIIQEIKMYQWKKDRDGNYEKIPTGPDHAMDAIRYGVMMKLGKRKEGSKLSFNFV